MSWETAWEEGRTPWDAGDSPPVLQALVESGALPTGRALVPGAGRGYDVLTLAGPERSVVGLDLAPVAKARFEELAADHPHRDQMEYVVEDAFIYAPPSPFDLVWDYTFLCALDPPMRPTWAAMMDRLLHPERGELLALIFPVVPDADPQSGPPYPMTPELVTALVDPFLELVSVDPVRASKPGREGKEFLGRYRRRT